MIEMDGLTKPLVQFSTRVESWSSSVLHTISRAAARGQHNELLLISILLFYLLAFFVNQFSYYMFCWRENEASETLSGVYKYELVRYIYYKYSTLPRGITINIAPKVGIFPEAKGRG